jgi:tetratricopeptide (TPR) repeat protein
MVQLGRVALAEGNIQEALELQRDALERLSSLLPADNAERADAHLEYGRSLLAAGDTVDAIMQFNTARNAFATRFDETSWRLAKIDYLKAAALDVQGRQKDASLLREIAVSRIDAALPDTHPLRMAVASGKIL